ncbi:YetF domain-containing protein [Bacillus salitolerans]|uniref:YetF domain-containing protein n=1 Tax=Bacillus salitolerans TaxID=1437434 RepID=A0ABW4LXU0_9BACI
MSISELSLRLAIAFITMLILARIIGRKEISQMTFFNFISGIAIGSIGANVVVNANLTLRNGVYALVGWTAFTILIGFVDIKSRRFRKLVEGQPLIVIKEGKIMERELRKTRLNVDALNALLREKNTFSIADVEYAIFETDGKLSVMKKEPKQPLTKSDLAIQPSTNNKYPISTGVIFDGEVNTGNLTKLNLKEDWLLSQLQQSGIQSFSEVLYAEVQKDGSLYIDKKNDQILH